MCSEMRLSLPADNVVDVGNGLSMSATTIYGTQREREREVMGVMGQSKGTIISYCHGSNAICPWANCVTTMGNVGMKNGNAYIFCPRN